MAESKPELTFAIGDLHGNFSVLQSVILRIQEYAGERSYRFVCCGDFIDRGPHSRSIIEMFMQGPADRNEWVILQGNHEEILLIAHEAPSLLNWWLKNGGGSTLQSYGYKDGDLFKEPYKIPVEHRRWLANLPVTFIDEHRAFVHAAFNPVLVLAEQDKQYMQWHYVTEESDYSYMGRHVVCGHIQHSDGPFMTPNRTNVDTYAWRYGRQAIAVFDNFKPGGPIEILNAYGTPVA